MAVRVLWLTKGLGPGGAERLLVEMARTLDRERVDARAAYVLPWKDHLAGELEAAGVQTTCLSRRDRDPTWPWRLRRLLTDEPVDVIHAHSPVPAVAARLLARSLPRSRRPVVMTTEHNTWTSHHPATRAANRLTNGGDVATFAVTDEARASMTGPAAEGAVVLVHGVDVAGIATRPDGERERIRAELGLPTDAVVAGTVANFRPQKDYPTLLAAAARMVERGVPFRLVAVGQGPQEEEITARVHELGLDDHVVLAGFRPDAVAVLAACDAFVLASAWEGLPVAVMEALALGLPIVATRVGGVAEALDDDHAILVPPRDPDALADALTTVLTDPDRRSALAAASRELAPTVDIARATEAVTSTYERVCAPARRPAAVGAQTRTPRSRAAAAEIRAATPADRDAVIALLGAALGWEDDERYRALYEWKHESNPFGSSLGFVAEDSNEIVAVRLFMRWAFTRGGRTVSAVRAVDTATHPVHQGRGLFTSLTLRALEAANAEGVDLVFNTPNEQSRPGYLKMGWREVGRLPAVTRPRGLGDVATIARSRTPAERWSLRFGVGRPVGDWLASGRWAELHDVQPVSSTDRRLRTATSPGFIRWRYGLAPLHYRVLDNGEDAAAIVRLRRRGPGTELVVAERLGDGRRADRLVASALAETGATHALRLGPADVRAGFVPLPGAGPILTWRAVADHGMPPLPNWQLELRDIELF